VEAEVLTVEMTEVQAVRGGRMAQAVAVQEETIPVQVQVL